MIAQLTVIPDMILAYFTRCCSLANRGYVVHQVVADGEGNETLNGVNIIDVGTSKGRFDRIWNAPDHMAEAIELNADLYHHTIQNSFLLPKLKNYGKRVIFDAHEDMLSR